MAATEPVSVPPVEFGPELALSHPLRSELRAALSFAAHRLGRAVVVRALADDKDVEDLPPSAGALVVWVPACSVPWEEASEEAWKPISVPGSNTPGALIRGASVVLCDPKSLSPGQIGPLVEAFIPMASFDFEPPESHVRQVRVWLADLRVRHLEDLDCEVRDTRRRADQLYYDLVHTERRVQELRSDAEALKAMDEKHLEALAQDQARAIRELIASGEYQSVDFLAGGTVHAVTGPVVIDHDGIEVPMGAYEIAIGEEGKIRIERQEPWPDTPYPHPHVATNFDPCLGDSRASIAKLVGSLRVAEALQVLRSFLESYNPRGAYEKLSVFAPDLIDEDDEEGSDPCGDCDERHTSYCILDCGENSGQFTCSDCGEFRSEDCYTSCRQNRDWSVASPCDDCEHKECVGEKCPYYAHRKELDGE